MSKQTILASAANITSNYLPRYNGTGYVNSLIQDDGTASITIQTANNTYLFVNKTAGASMNIISTSAQGIVGTVNDYPLVFRVNDSAKMYITSAGNVGIGTASPVSTSLNGSVTIVKTYGNDTPTSTTAQNYYNNQSNLYLFGRNAGLTLVGNTNEECIIAFASPSSDYIGGIRYETQATSAGGALRFQTGGANERMRITAGGEVVIGTTSSFNNEKLRVAGTISSGVSSLAITGAVEVSCPSGSSTTVWTCPDYPRVMYYMVFVRINSGANADTYSCYAVIAASNIAGAKLLTVSNSSGMGISVSGRDIRVTQSSGVTQTVHTSVIQIFSNGGTV